jgi:hypothetical protein
MFFCEPQAELRLAYYILQLLPLGVNPTSNDSAPVVV